LLEALGRSAPARREARARTIERNARAKLTSVKGLGRRFAWESFLADRDGPPLFRGCYG
jgi:hypothetical protein